MQMLVAWATLSPSSSLGEILSLGDPKKKRSSATLTNDFLWKRYVLKSPYFQDFFSERQ